MKYLAFEKIFDKNPIFKFENCLKQFWKIKNNYSQSTPKIFNNLLYLHNCSAIYTLPNGNKLHAKSGDIVIAPTQSMYEVNFYRESEDAFTIGINCTIMIDNEDVCISPTPIIFNNINYDLILFFEKINHCFFKPNINYCTISQNLFLIMDKLSQSTDNDNSDSILLPAIQLLLGDRYDLTSNMLAEACNISDVYFRKIFKNKYGISPSKHLIQRKVDKAKHYLTYTDMNISEISYLLNFIDTSYFCKQFKQLVGTTPNIYRQKTSHIK